MGFNNNRRLGLYFPTSFKKKYENYFPLYIYKLKIERHVEIPNNSKNGKSVTELLKDL